MTTQAVVADYGSGNLFSIGQALTRCGGKVSITADPDTIAQANHLVIPGVGAFGQCMAKLREKALIPSLREAVDRGARVLGICVGMQVLFEESEEFGSHQGLGIIAGRVVKIPSIDKNGEFHKIPYVGWSRLKATSSANWGGTILANVPRDSPCYFVHSFMAQPECEENRLADTFYGETRVCAAVRAEKVFGTQFHPEKSGETGLAILKHFLRL